METFVVEPDVIYVLDKNENLLAEFQKDDENTLINPRIVETQNAETVLTFSIPLNNPKWNEIKNPENLYIVNDKMYSTNFEGCFTETISDNGEELISVTAYERQKLLSRHFVRAWNSTTGFEIVDTFMVVVLSNGDLPLYNNGNEVISKHSKGTSGYVLDALLYGTGWTTDICDVEGIFDFETDQIDIYENILKVQEIWGGILVFDSLNKKVSHRDETKFLPYSGYEVRYKKNMQSLEKLYNNKIITKLCPLGEGGLNIKAVNDGSEWLTNFEYTDTVLEGIENNPDITDQGQLKAWGERKLKDLCKPTKELTVQTILLHKLEGYELEEIKLNDIVDVIDYQEIPDNNEQLRVVGYEYGIWDYSDAIIQLSDITLDSTDIFKKAVKATADLNNGTVSAEKVVVYEQGGTSVEQELKRVDETIVQTKSEFTKADDEIRATVEQVTSNVDNLNNEVVSQSRELSSLSVQVGEINSYTERSINDIQKNINDIQQTAEQLSISISNIGGDNLIRNSAMKNGTKFWLPSVQVSYIESNTPPPNPLAGSYWYCTDNFESYVANQLYTYTNGEWVKSQVNRKALDTAQNLLKYTTSSEIFEDGTRADTKTISGRVLKFDAGYEYQVTHIFNTIEPIAINNNEKYLVLSCYIKNNITMGNVGIGIMFLDTDNLQYTETIYSLYEPAILVTPDDFKDLTKIELKVKIPQKEDFIPVIVSATPPSDTSKKWLDINVFLPKEYNSETSEWEVMNTQMSLYDESSKSVYVYRSYFGFYYQTPVNFDNMQIKTFYPVFTFYPAFRVYTGDVEPTPIKGVYWNNKTTNIVKRPVFINNQFVEWETLPIPSNALFPGAIMGLPMFEYVVPIAGFFELADIKLEYNIISSKWTQHPDELYAKNYKMDGKGFSIQSGQNVMFIDEDEIIATYKSLAIFEINKDLASFKKIKVQESVEIKTFVFKEQVINGIDYLLFY